MVIRLDSVPARHSFTPNLFLWQLIKEMDSRLQLYNLSKDNQDPSSQMALELMMANMKIRTGMQVEIELVDLDGKGEHQEFIIVPDKLADYTHHLLGVGTPLAKALIGRTVDEEVPYRFDDIVRVRILAVRPVVSENAYEAASQREAEYRQALADFEKRNAATFAASFSGKWGDYDPDGVEKWENEQKTKK
jgi:hypothetical protein